MKSSYKYWTNLDLAEDLMSSTSIIASHSSIPNIIEKLTSFNIENEVFDLSQKPIFVYANNAAAKLWELSLDKLIGSASINTAAEQEQSERHELLVQVEKNGYVNNYSGIRVSSQGKKFMIEKATVWQVFIEHPSRKIGQAVKFDKWHYID